jgi:hypothetical protein
MSWRGTKSILWFPACLAVLLPVALLIVCHQPTPHALSVGVGATRAPRVLALVRSASGDGGAGPLVLLFPLMMAGVVTVSSIAGG